MQSIEGKKIRRGDKRGNRRDSKKYKEKKNKLKCLIMRLWKAQEMLQLRWMRVSKNCSRSKIVVGQRVSLSSPKGQEYRGSQVEMNLNLPKGLGHHKVTTTLLLNIQAKLLRTKESKKFRKVSMKTLQIRIDKIQSRKLKKVCVKMKRCRNDIT